MIELLASCNSIIENKTPFDESFEVLIWKDSCYSVKLTENKNTWPKLSEIQNAKKCKVNFCKENGYPLCRYNADIIDSVYSAELYYGYSNDSYTYNYQVKGECIYFINHIYKRFSETKIYKFDSKICLN